MIILSFKTMVFLFLLSIVSLTFGGFIFLKPLESFAIQKKFYELINWRIEPISLKREIRNTKIMGIFLILFVIVFWCYLIFGSNIAWCGARQQ